MVKGKSLLILRLDLKLHATFDMCHAEEIVPPHGVLRKGMYVPRVFHGLTGVFTKKDIIRTQNENIVRAR